MAARVCETMSIQSKAFGTCDHMVPSRVIDVASGFAEEIMRFMV